MQIIISKTVQKLVIKFCIKLVPMAKVKFIPPPFPQKGRFKIDWSKKLKQIAIANFEGQMTKNLSYTPR